MIRYRNVDFISKTLNTWMPWFQFFFGCEVNGLENLVFNNENEKYLCVANHSIGILVEGFSLLDAWQKKFNEKNICFAMAHYFFFKFPGIGYVMKKVGCIPASYESAQQAFDHGHSVLVFPGGNYEAIRTYYERDLCDFNQRKGWIKIAIKNNVSIVPISITGSHSVNPVFYRSRVLSYLMILPKLFNITWFPISLAQIVYTLLIGIITSLFFPFWAVGLVCYFTYGFSFLIPILPSKIKIQMSSAINLMDFNIANKTKDELLNDDVFLQKCYNSVTEIIQKNMDILNLKNV